MIAPIMVYSYLVNEFTFDFWRTRVLPDSAMRNSCEVALLPGDFDDDAADNRLKPAMAKFSRSERARSSSAASSD